MMATGTQRNTKEAIMSKIISAFVALSVLALTVLVGISMPGNAADATGLPTTYWQPQDVSPPYAPAG
jgi:hypothetical protein